MLKKAAGIAAVAGAIAVTLINITCFSTDPEEQTSENKAPVLTSPGDKLVYVGSTLSFTLSASDTDGDNLAYSGANLPTGATVNSSSGAFSWKPAVADTGNHTVVLIASDGTLSDSVSITISVMPDTSGNNTSTKICPDQKSVDYFKVVQPNGGETFTVGDQCTVIVHSSQPEPIVLELYVGDGLTGLSLPQEENLMVPDDSVFIFEITETMQDFMLNDFSTISDSCLIKASVYAKGDKFDYSDCYFSIRN